MPSKLTVLIRFLFLSCLISLVASCSSDKNETLDGDMDTNEPTIEELARQALEEMDSASYGEAQNTFLTLLSRDSEHPQALMGLVLIQFQDWLGTINSLLGLLGGDEAEDGDADTDAEDELENDASEIVGLIERKAINNLLGDFSAQAEVTLMRLEKLQNRDTDFSFPLKNFSFDLAQAHIGHLEGEVDQADASPAQEPLCILFSTA